MKKKKSPKKIKNNNIVVEKKEEVIEPIIKNTKLINFISKPYIDILLIILIIGLVIFLHYPSLKINHIDDNTRVYYLNEKGEPYLFDMDSYYYARKARELSTGEEKKLIVNKSEDKYQTIVSNENNSVYTIFLSFIASFIFKIVNIFKNIDIYTIVVHLGPIISSLVVIPAYIFMKRQTNRAGAIFSAVLAGVSASYFAHQNFSTYDTDILLYILPLSFMTSFIESLKETGKKRNIYGVLSIISYILLMISWDVYGVYYFLVIGIVLSLLFIALIKDKFKIKEIIKRNEIKIGFLLIAVYTLLSLLVRKEIEISIIESALSVLKGSSFSTLSYPSPSKFISEMSAVKIFEFSDNLLDTTSTNLINRLGGIMIVSFFLMAILFLFEKTIRYFKNKEEHKSEYILFVSLLIWAVFALISVKAGSRFIKIAAIPVNLLAAYFVGSLSVYLKKYNYNLFAYFLLIVALVSPCMGAYRISQSTKPSANDSLVESANYIKNNTGKNDVIASWWDFGYFFEYQSERRAICDGGTFNGRYFFYLAKAFLTQNETLSSNIFKMLSYKGVSASILIDEYLGTPKKGSETLVEILSKDKTDAEKILKEKYKLNDNQVKNIIELSHPDLDYKIVLVITENMQRMKTAMSYYANYDFEKPEPDKKDVSSKSILLKLYNTDEDTKVFTHLYNNTDVLGKYSTNIWLIN